MIPTTSTDLVRCFAPAGRPLPRVVCLPHAGGSATFFHPLAGMLAGEVEVLAVQYPGRQDRRHEPHVADLRHLADDVATEITEIAPTDGPLVVFGHSMGATLGYEVVRRLERAGREVAHLIASGRRAPSWPGDDRDPRLWSDGRLIAELRTLAGDELPLPDDEMLHFALPAVRADYRAVQAYVHDDGPPVRGGITAPYGTADPRVTPQAVHAWAAHTTGGFRAVPFPGGHFYLAGRMAATATLIRAAFQHDTGTDRGGA